MKKIILSHRPAFGGSFPPCLPSGRLWRDQRGKKFRCDPTKGGPQGDSARVPPTAGPVPIWLIAVLVAMTFLIPDYGDAGLINYNRRNRTAGTATGTDQAQDATPVWLTSAPVVKNKTEQKYDINRDGRLQTAETTIFLRDVLDVIDAKGGYTIDSDILKEYDKNKDGVISRKEATPIQEQVR